MDVALEDVNLLLSDLDLRVAGNEADNNTLARSSDLVVKQVLALEQALATAGVETAAAAAAAGENTITNAGGIVDVAIARGMPRPAGRVDDTAARCSAACNLVYRCFHYFVQSTAVYISFVHGRNVSQFDGRPTSPVMLGLPRSGRKLLRLNPMTA